MRFISLPASLIVLGLVGCSGDTTVNSTDTDAAQESGDAESGDAEPGSTEIVNTQAGDAELDADLETESEGNGSTTVASGGISSSIIAQFSGATFVSLDQTFIFVDDNNNAIVGNRIVSFGADTVEFIQADGVETGQYTADTSSGVAQFTDRDIEFSADGSNLIWDSQNYERSAISQFSSQSDLEEFFKNSEYETTEEFDLGQNVAGEQVVGNYSVSFSEAEVSWMAQGAVESGTYTFVDDSTFHINLPNSLLTVVVLDGNKLVIDSVVYDKVTTNQFSSQETLITFLDGRSYQSATQQNIGEPDSDIGILGYWFIDFTENNYTWAHQVMTELGTVEYLDNTHFIAVSGDQESTIEVDGDDIFWGGIRYTRIIGQ